MSSLDSNRCYALVAATLCFVFPLSLFFMPTSTKIDNMFSFDDEQMYSVIGAITLFVSELLPFVTRTDSNGVLHGILRVFQTGLESRRSTESKVKKNS
jgi:hypothetical protein